MATLSETLLDLIRESDAKQFNALRIENDFCPVDFGFEDFRGYDLTGFYLAGIDFSCADFRGAIINDVNFKGCTFHSTIMSDDLTLNGTVKSFRKSLAKIFSTDPVNEVKIDADALEAEMLAALEAKKNTAFVGSTFVGSTNTKTLEPETTTFSYSIIFVPGNIEISTIEARTEINAIEALKCKGSIGGLWLEGKEVYRAPSFSHRKLADPAAAYTPAMVLACEAIAQAMQAGALEASIMSLEMQASDRFKAYIEKIGLYEIGSLLCGDPETSANVVRKCLKDAYLNPVQPLRALALGYGFPFKDPTVEKLFVYLALREWSDFTGILSYADVKIHAAKIMIELSHDRMNEPKQL